MAVEIRELKDLVQEAIDKGATTVEEVHKKIAGMPFDMLAKIGPIQTQVGQAREIHDQTIGTIYETIRAINQKAGELAEEILNKIQPKSQPKSQPKK
ncbi:hypothetical protein WDW89_06050 [Deltaproteobacteria bacterium TL4]